MSTKKIEKFREPDHVFPATLTSSEQDVFALLLCEISKACAAQDKAKKADEDIKPLPYLFEFSEATLMQVFDCSKDNIRKVLEPAAKSLQSRQVGYSDKGGFDYFSPVGRAIYKRGTPFRIEMLPSVVEMLSDYKGFSELDFKLFVGLSGRYEKRILRELSRWKDKADKELLFSIKEFREKIGVGSKYKAFDNFKRRCIGEPLAEIISKSNGAWVATDKKKLGYELIKSGRSYTHIRLCMKYNPKPAVNKAVAIPAPELTYEGAVQTYSDLVNNTRLPSTAELDNLKARMGELLLEGFNFDEKFREQLKKAAQANQEQADTN